MNRIHGWARCGGMLCAVWLLCTSALAQEPEAAAPPEFETAAPVSPAGDPAAEAGPATDLEGPASPDSGRTSIEQAWLAPADSLEERVVRTRRVALEQGAWNFDPAARGLAGPASEGSALDRAFAAVELAPDLPAAHMRLARLLWLQGDSPMSAVRRVVSGFESIVRHPEASLWFAGSGLQLLALALVAGGLFAIFVAGIVAFPHAAHDLGHAVSSSTPEFARFAGLASLLMLPLALGEGVLGLAVGFLVVAVLYGSRRQRVAMGVAIALVVLGAFPVARWAGAALGAFPGDPTLRAAFSTAQGLTSPVDLARLSRAQDDPLAVRGLAIHARRSGNLGEAATLYQRLLADAPDDVAILNNAANVSLDLGHMDSALELYGRAVDIEESPVVLFNLAQAYGRAFQVEDLNRTLAHAQNIHGDLVAKLTALQGTETRGFVVDFPLSGGLAWRRALNASIGAELAAEFREPFAPGRLGSDWRGASTWIGGVFALSALLAWRVSPSRWCGRCGDRMCPRCDPEQSGAAVCGSCTRLFFQPEKTDKARRLARVNELRHRELRINRVATALSMLIPGAAGLLADRPMRCVWGALFFALAVVAIVYRNGVVPDPLVAGAAAPLAFIGVASLAVLAYVTLVAMSLSTRRNR